MGTDSKSSPKKKDSNLWGTTLYKYIDKEVGQLILLDEFHLHWPTGTHPKPNLDWQQHSLASQSLLSGP